MFAQGLTIEHHSDLVYEGRLIGETSYPQRSERHQEFCFAGEAE
ncbi:CRISPR-associated protein Cas4 [Eisenibacter elegans]|nr:CRISPR-associated protein Cas4 [Eisenibacter elegans]